MEQSIQAFDWRGWDNGKLPTLEPHSAAKLNVLRDYVEDYIAILCSRAFGVERFRITLVDGFSGGGVYDQNKIGSPFVLIKAVETAEAKLNDFGRIKKIKIDCDYHFVDENRTSIDCLCYQLENSEYKGRINKSIFLHHGKFDAKYPAIVDRLLKRHSKGGARVIFFLDQCGYSQISPHVLRTICEQLGDKVEFIINFAIEWLEDYIGDNKTFQKVFPKLGLGEVLPMEKLIRLRKQNQVHWKFLVESEIGPAYKKISGMPFFSPFYIEPADSHRGYWLLHLAPHERARSAMLDVHWRYANSHRHFGHAGLNMLAFKPEADPTGYLEGMSFGALTRETAKQKLSEDFARVIRDSHADGISFEQFATFYGNKTIANNSLMGEVISELTAQSELLVTGPKGSQKRSNKIHDDDIIFPCNQLLLPSMTTGK